MRAALGGQVHPQGDAAEAWFSAGKVLRDRSVCGVQVGSGQCWGDLCCVAAFACQVNPRAEPRPSSRARMHHRPRESHACQRRRHRVPRILGADGAVSLSLRHEPGVIRALATPCWACRHRAWLSESMRSERAYTPWRADRLGDRRGHACRPRRMGCSRAVGRAIHPLFGGDRLLPPGTPGEFLPPE